MEAEDDMIVLVVVNDNEKAKWDSSTSEDLDASLDVNNIIETAQRHGEYIPIKLEAEDDEYEYDNLEDGINKSETGSNHWPDIKEEPKDEEIEKDIGVASPVQRSSEQEPKEEVIEQELDKDSLPQQSSKQDLEEEEIEQVMGEDSPPQRTSKQRFKMLKPWQQRSFVAELREQYEELREDEELLISTLERIMRKVQPPPPPPDYCVMNHSKIMYECVYCGYFLETLPAASRHFTEKHGPRYLVCYACGVDFRSTTNLYKHEKRCVAPDARTVLRARAAFLGRKGRGRPKTRLIPHKSATKQDKYLCSLCSAEFVSKCDLDSHENLHRGERPYRCHVCPRAYTSSSALARHAKRHSGVEYICDHCGRSFKTRSSLLVHMETHQPMRKHGCSECSRRFAQKSALTLHVLRVHRNLPPPCACQICPKRYPRMYLLKAHMKREHGMTIITRKMFLKSLPTMTENEIKQAKDIVQCEQNGMLAFPDRNQPIKAESEIVVVSGSDLEE